MQQTLGSEEATRLCRALTETEAPTSIRGHEPVGEVGSVVGYAGERVPWCSRAIYLSERPQFTLDPLLHAGEYYVQEASSMFVEQAYRTILQHEADSATSPQRGAWGALGALDLCAAPGGKSTLWRSLLPDEALLVCNEPDRRRAEILNENMIKWGHPHVLVTQAWPADFGKHCEEFFDIIGADVPCSGEGMFRKDPQSRQEWSLDNVHTCARTQRAIIKDVWPALRPGGWLVYSTCTFNRLEDEDNVDWICRELGAEYVPIATDPAWGVTETERGYHFYPHKTKGEGFFLALLHKPGSTEKDRKSYPSKLPRGLERAVFPREPYEQKGKKLIPQHWVALTDCPEREQYPRHELTLEEARQYLRREVLILPPDVPRGYVIVCYHGRPLGFVNNLGTRANNMYPQEWRIRHL